MDIRVVRKDEEFDQLQSDWNRLTEKNPATSVFQGWDWQRTWWRHYGKKASLRILVVSESGHTIAILPLYLHRQRLFRVLTQNTLSLIGTGGDTSPDYLGIITNLPNTDSLRDCLIRQVMALHTEWDTLNLANLVSQDDFTGKLVDYCEKHDLPARLKQTATLPQIHLPASWDDYLGTLSSNRRAQIRRRRRKFESIPGAQFGVCQQQSELPSIIDSLISLHHKRWQNRSDSYAFSSKEYISFHREVINSLFNKQAVRLCYLKLEDKIIAVLYCYKWQDKFLYFQGGIDPDYESLSPGMVMMSYAIELAIQEGASVFDMLKGDYSFKRSLAKQESIAWGLTVYNRTLAGRLLRLRRELLPAMKRRLVQSLQPQAGIGSAINDRSLSRSK